MAFFAKNCLRPESAPLILFISILKQMISISHKYLPDSFSVTCSKESFVRRHLVSSFIIDLQPSEGVLIKKWSENMQQIYRRTPMQSDFIEVTLWHGCFPGNLQNIFRISFDKNTYRRLLLVIRIKAILYRTICMVRFAWLLFVFSMIQLIWTCKLRNRNNFLQ